MDFSEEELLRYQSSQVEPEDFTDFWSGTLAGARQHPIDVRLEPVGTMLTTLDVFDVTFAGYGGEPVRGWLRTPRGTAGTLPTIVEYIGYGGGRGLHWENLFWPSTGYAHLLMDTRGQGSKWSLGATADSSASGPQIPGMMTRGIADPSTYYYRRLVTDAVRAVDAAHALDVVDSSRVVVYGHSQGGGLSLASAALSTGVAAAMAEVPFLCDFPRAVRVTDEFPYQELVQYLAIHRDETEQVHRTLSYFDGVNFARHARIPAYFSAAHMDAICPPSTVYAAHNAYAGPKQITLWPFNGHEGGGPHDLRDEAEFLSTTLA
jgi:cephalosporin-C deacetylase